MTTRSERKQGRKTHTTQTQQRHARGGRGWAEPTQPKRTRHGRPSIRARAPSADAARDKRTHTRTHTHTHTQGRAKQKSQRSQGLYTEAKAASTRRRMLSTFPFYFLTLFFCAPVQPGPRGRTLRSLFLFYLNFLRVWPLSRLLQCAASVP